MQRKFPKSPGLALLCASALAWWGAVRTDTVLAQQQTISAKPLSSSPVAAWSPIGPNAVLTPRYGPVTGRITALAFDPNDATGNTVYFGATGGGVWKSTNAAGPVSAITFHPLTDTLPVFAATADGGSVPSLSIGALAVQPLANGVVLAGTGDPNNAADSFYGEGLLRSTDAGLTWTLIPGSNDGVNGKHYFTGLATAGLAWSAASPSVVVAAMSTSPQSTAVGAASSASVPGLYYSTDAGITWRMSTLYDGASVVQQPIFTAQRGNPATSVVWSAARASFIAAVRFHGYYASTDGATWTRLAAQPGAGLTTANCPVNPGSTGSPACPLYRGALAVQPATGDLYALSVDSANGDQGLWQDLCAMTSTGACATRSPVWSTRLDAAAFESGSDATIAQGRYNLVLSAAPAANAGTLLLAGTQDLYRCALSAAAPSACTWRNTTNTANGCATPAGVAPAQHAIATLTLNAGALVLLGNDGGLWRSTDGIAQTGAACSAADASHFDNLNPAIAASGSLAEAVALAQSPTDANSLLAGLGASGTAGTAATSSAAATWPQISSAEGGQPLLDPDTPINWFATIGAGINLKLCAKGASCTAADFTAPATIGSTQVSGDAALLHAPFLLDPAQTSNLLTATCRVWRGPATDGTLWTPSNALSPAFDGSATPCTAASALVRSLAAGGPAATSAMLQNSGSNVLYAGMAGALSGGGTKVGGHVFATRNANTVTSATAWTDLALSPVTNGSTGVFNPSGYDISAIAVDSHDPAGATVYVTIAGFGGDITVPHLYRSTDFGAHWQTVNANLPAASANAVLVDPNDANTVYVATDAGVFVTQAIATCATASCWSQLGTGLPNAPVLNLLAGPNLPTGDGRHGLLRAATYGRGLWQTPLLTAIGTAQPALTLSATSLTFDPQAVATQSSAQTVTVTSTGNAPAVFGTPILTGDFPKDFTETDTCASQTLPVGGTCTVRLQFAPSATGTRSGLLTIYANIAGGQTTVALTGTGTPPASIVLTPTALAFAPTTINATSTAQIVNIANTGGAPATLNSIAVSGDFTLAANTCGATLAAQTACAVSITFTPSAAGPRLGTLTVIDSAGTQTATLTGTGQSPPTDTLTPAAFSFAQQQIGSTSAAQQLTLTNAGDQPLTSIAVGITGDFTAINGCGATLAGHATCAISVTFIPSATGPRTGVLTVTDAFRAQTVALTGIGVAPPGVSLTPATLSFGALGVGLLSAPQTVTLTNNGGSMLSLTSIALSPQTGTQFAILTNTCGSTVAMGGACTLQIAFAPTSAGLATGTLVLTDNAPSLTQTVSLTATGIDFTFAAGGLTTATVASGATATFPMLLNSPTGLTGNAAFTCIGAPAHSLCTVSPSVAALGSTSTITVTVQTGLAQAHTAPPPGFFGRYGLITFACVLPLFLARRRYRHATLACLALATLSSLTGCSAARIIPGSGTAIVPTPTPAGTYTLTVTATSAGVTHSVPLTLIVQ